MGVEEGTVGNGDALVTPRRMVLQGPRHPTRSPQGALKAARLALQCALQCPHRNQSPLSRSETGPGMCTSSMWPGRAAAAGPGVCSEDRCPQVQSIQLVLTLPMASTRLTGAGAPNSPLQN